MPKDTPRTGPGAPPRSGPLQRLRRRRVWTVGRLLVLVGLLGLTYGIFFLAAMRVATNARAVKVPDLSGKSVNEARQTLASLGLSLRLDAQRRPDPKVPADHILSQEFAPGTVIRRQRSVRVRVSDGQRAPVIPSVLGQPEASASATLAQDQVDVSGRAEIRSASYPPGTVVAQDPPAQSRAPGVTLLINRGEDIASFVMPDLIGTNGNQVVAQLQRSGFRVTISATVPYPGLPKGIVVRQLPQAGFQIARGELISVEVSQ